MDLSRYNGHGPARGQRFAIVPGVLMGIAVCAASPARAEFQPYAATGVTYSDNVARLENDEQSGAQAAATAGFRFYVNAARWNADVEAAGTYLRYFSDNTVSSNNDTLGYVVARAAASIVPRYISWELLENYGQAATSPFGSVHPVDRQNINYLTTGPNFALPLGRDNRVDLQLRHSDVRYSEADTQDNRRNSAGLALVHEWTPIRTISLNYYAERVKFTNSTEFNDYDLQSAFITINSAPRRMRIGLDLGATQVDDGVDKERGALAGVLLWHEVGRVSSIQLYGRRAFADSAESFRLGQGGAMDQILIDQDVQVVAEPYRQTYISADYTTTLPRTSLIVGPYWVDEDYIRNDAISRRRYGARADASYVISPFVRVAGYTSYEKTTAAAAGVPDITDIAIGLGLANRFTDSAEVTFRLERYKRQSDITPFVENRAVITLAWEPRRRGPERESGGALFNRTRGINSQPTDRGRPVVEEP